MKPQESKYSVPLTLTLQLRAYIDSVGFAEASRVTGLHRETLAKACSGFGVRKGTILVVQQALQNIAASHVPMASPHAAPLAMASTPHFGDSK